MNKQINTIYYFLLLFVFISCAQTPTKNSCHAVRAALDVGSGSTKIKVARVNNCTAEIEKTLFEKSIADS